MRTFIENYLHFIKNCLRPPYEKLKPLKSDFIENSNFDINRDPCSRITRMFVGLFATVPKMAKYTYICETLFQIRQKE